MWREMEKHLGDFSSAVLTGVDGAGYPLSVRCQPEADRDLGVLRVTVSPGVDLRPGPAGLLCHRHDELLSGLKCFLVRGRLERDDRGWLLHPEKFVPGAGVGGLRGFVRFIRDGRRGAARYLAKRGLKRPTVPWDDVTALWAEIKSSKTEA